jgi:hypothetical protein
MPEPVALIADPIDDVGVPGALDELPAAHPGPVDDIANEEPDR